MDKKYLANKILNASKSELVAVLYEAIINNLEIGIESIDSGDDENLFKSVDKAREIISELNATTKGDSKIALDSKSLYIYINKIITEGKTKKDKEKLKEAIKVVTPLYEAWVELASKDSNENLNTNKSNRHIVAGMTYGKDNLNDHVLNDKGGLGQG